MKGNEKSRYPRIGGSKRRFRGLFSAPFPPAPNPSRLAALTFLLGFSHQASKAFGVSTSELWFTFLDIHSYSPFFSLPSLFEASYFGSSSSVPTMDFFRSTLRVMARGTHWGKTCLRLRQACLEYQQEMQDA